MCGIARQILVMGLGWFQRLGQDFILPHILPFWMARLHVIYCKPQQLPHYRIKPCDCGYIRSLLRLPQALPSNDGMSILYTSSR